MKNSSECLVKLCLFIRNIVAVVPSQHCDTFPVRTATLRLQTATH